MPTDAFSCDLRRKGGKPLSHKLFGDVFVDSLNNAGEDRNTKNRFHEVPNRFPELGAGVENYNFLVINNY